MISVAEAERIIGSLSGEFGSEFLPLEACIGRYLAGDIAADRDLPPFDRATMDGIAMRFESWQKGIRSFRLAGILAAGQTPEIQPEPDECLEIMTGAVIPEPADTVIPYEDLELREGRAYLGEKSPVCGQNIHIRGRDHRAGEILLKRGLLIDAASLGVLAAVGQQKLAVRRLPVCSLVSTGDELVDISHSPGAFQIRSSNDLVLGSVLLPWGIRASRYRLGDESSELRRVFRELLENSEVILISGGVSRGRYDQVPPVLESLGVIQEFHRIAQRPGKPFWFGRHPSGTLVFGFPGNPVSSFLCLHRYFLPWLQTSLCGHAPNPWVAELAAEINFSPALTYFAQVKLTIDSTGTIIALPREGHGSGDLANLLDSDAFLELPAHKDRFSAGGIYPLWPFRPIG